MKIDYDFVIKVDTREQQPYVLKHAWFCLEKIETGDYSIKGYEDQITVERKTLKDLYGSFTGNRDRFKKEFERLSKIKNAYLFIECNVKDLLNQDDVVYSSRKVTPQTILNSIFSWSIRYDVKPIFCESRESAEKCLLSLFKMFWYNLKKSEELEND